MACACCGCGSDTDCPGDFNKTKCCNGTCVEDGCCAESIETTCLPACTLGCKLIESGPQAGKYRCFSDPCNPFP